MGHTASKGQKLLPSEPTTPVFIFNSELKFCKCTEIRISKTSGSLKLISIWMLACNAPAVLCFLSKRLRGNRGAQESNRTGTGTSDYSYEERLTWLKLPETDMIKAAKHAIQERYYYDRDVQIHEFQDFDSRLEADDNTPLEVTILSKRKWDTAQASVGRRCVD